jgi:hypothetical protein
MGIAENGKKNEDGVFWCLLSCDQPRELPQGVVCGEWGAHYQRDWFIGSCDEKKRLLKDLSNGEVNNQHHSGLNLWDQKYLYYQSVVD